MTVRVGREAAMMGVRLGVLEMLIHLRAGSILHIPVEV